ncbi:hypothetical protein PMG11_04270 [Penicillium brasilianum]|uniref:BED-type domain-containing protein n=1 Tax=Penicillium brasilianum TaxID=104259 RepID=A0A0F7VC77_PENBI|nr:hypothetical protein PMG11_04270 [Penicillium brasilianum]
MCKRCDAILEHPYATKKDANGRVGRHGTTTITRHLQTLTYQKATRVRQQRGGLKGFLHSLFLSKQSHPADRPFSQEAWEDKLLQFITINRLPFNLVKHPTFRDLISHSQSAPTPSLPIIQSADTIRRRLSVRVKEQQRDTLGLLPEHAKISVALDCWTSPFGQAFMAITGYFIDADWVYREVLLGDLEGTLPNTPPPSTGPESDTEFVQNLFHDANHIARTKQLHAKRHTATCFKYRPHGSMHITCRFGMPRDLIDASKIDEHGIIHLARNHGWVNPWNPTIASCIRSNHDISWIPTVSKSLSLLYYITNYATKDDISPWQVVAKAALLKQMIDRATFTPAPTTADIRLRQRGMDKFALRCFNSLSQDREISGVQVASTLLQLPSYYTLNYNFTRINLWWLRRYVRSMVPLEHPRDSLPSDTIREEPCSYDRGVAAPANIFDNYRWRGNLLSSLSIFEYCMIVRTKRLQDATTEDISFHEAHPRYRTHIQRLAQSPSQSATVTLQGELSGFQTAEDSVPGGHPITTAIQNDVAEILLGLFIPWQDIPSLAQVPSSTSENFHDVLHNVWLSVEPTLPAFIRTFARNIELLRKSKSDCQADALLRSRSTQHTSPVDQDLGNPPYSASDSENENPDLPRTADNSLSSETLIAAFFAISQR